MWKNQPPSSHVAVAHWDCINSGVSEDLLFTSSIDAVTSDDGDSDDFLQKIATTIKSISGVDYAFATSRITTNTKTKESSLSIRIVRNMMENAAGTEDDDDNNIEDIIGKDEKKTCSDREPPSPSPPSISFDEVKDILTQGATSTGEENIIPEWVCDNAIEIFTEVVNAVKKVACHDNHDDGKPTSPPSFSMQSFIQVVGTLLALFDSGVHRISCSPLPLVDGGVVDTITMKLLMGMPTTTVLPPTAQQSSGSAVLTPIGVAMLRVLSGVSKGKKNRRPTSVILQKSGLGTVCQRHSTNVSSSDNYPKPAIRILIGEVDQHLSVGNQGGMETTTATTHDNSVTKSSRYQSKMWMSDSVTQFACNLDDMTGESLAFVIGLLLKNGAVDAWVSPIVMKKGRPAHTLNCLCLSPSSPSSDHDYGNVKHSATAKKLLELIFRHTTTLGVRIYTDLDRAKLRRTVATVQTPFGVTTTENGGLVRVKVGQFLNSNEILSAKAEFDDCKEIAEETGVPLASVADHAIRKFYVERPKETLMATESDDYDSYDDYQFGDGDESGSGNGQVEIHYEEESC